MILNKIILRLVWIIGAIGFIIFYINIFINDQKADEKFCKLFFCGKIEKITTCEKEFYYVKIENDTTYYLGMHVHYGRIPIEVGDSIMKKEDCYKVILRKKGVDYDISSPISKCSCGTK